MKEKTLHTDIEKMIAAGHFNKAVQALSQSALSGPGRALLDQAATTYKYMLKYFCEAPAGSVDPSRPALYASIRESLRQANDLLLISTLERYSDDDYFTARRNRSVRADARVDISAPKLQREILSEADEQGRDAYLENMTDDLFTDVWTTPHLSASEADLLRDLLLEQDTRLTNAQAVVLGALLLGALRYYDPAKLLLLIRVALSEAKPMVKARALAGALLIVSRWGKRIYDNPEVRAALQTLSEDPEMAVAVRKFVPAMLRTIDTDRISRRVKDDIIPSLMKARPDMEQTMRKMGAERLSPEEIEENPEWEELLKSSGISDKLMELTEMQMEGADIFMSAFSNMKGFYFFNRLSNWFLPFDASHTQVRRATEGLPAALLEAMGATPLFCASDKYSMMLAMGQMPESQKQLMTSQVGAQLEGMNTEITASLESLTPTLHTEMATYLKDLFRFFRLKNRHHAPDPFADLFQMPEVEPFTALLQDGELLRSMAEFYFKYGYWRAALQMYDAVMALGETVGEDLLQKQGYSHQMLGEHSEALQCYERAELLNADSRWLLKRIAILLRDMGRYEESIAYQRRLLENDPENLRQEKMLASTLMLAGQGAEALKIFYKIKYLEPENTAIARPMAWCEFLQGNYRKSLKLYHSLEDMNATDLLNCGHAHLAQGEVGAAREAYGSSARLLPGGTAEFRTLFEADRPYLLDVGVDPLTLTLLADIL